MAFNISEFSSRVNKIGLAKSNLFVLRMSPPPSASIADSINFDQFRFLCQTVDLPGLELQTADILNQGFGSVERRPQSMQYPVLPAIFMMDSNFAVLSFFHKWMQSIINYDVGAGPLSEVRGALPYEMGYKSEYATTIYVDVFADNTTEKKYTYTFYNAYPITVGSIQASWANSAEIMTLPIGFTFDQMKVDGTIQGTVTGALGRGSGLLSYISALNTYGQVIDQLNRPRDIQDVINTFTNVSGILASS